MVTPEQIGKTIIRLRQLKGLSQEALANDANIDRRYMSDLENGKRNLSLDVLNRLATVFDISLSALLFEAEDNEKTFHTVSDLKHNLEEKGHSHTIIFEEPSYITAVLGIDDRGRIVYSYSKMIQYLMLTDGISYDDAIEFIDYNTIRAIPYMGELAPIVIYDI